MDLSKQQVKASYNSNAGTREQSKAQEIGQRWVRDSIARFNAQHNPSATPVPPSLPVLTSLYTTEYQWRINTASR